MSAHVLWAEHAVTAAGARRAVRIDVRDGRFTEVAETARPCEPGAAEILTGWVVPGFVDSHSHGGGGYDYATTDQTEALAARRFHRGHGTTSTLASLVAAS